MLRPITSRWLLLMALCLALTMAGLSVHWARTDLREAWGRVAKNDARVLSQLGQDLGRHVNLGDRVLRALRDDWEDPGLQGLAPALRQRLLFKRLTAGDPVFAATLILDRSGRAVADSAGLVPRPVTATQRDYFQAQWHAGRDALYISHPFVSQIKKIPSLALSRRLQDEEGHFAGVAVGLVPLAHWQDLLDSAELGGDSLLWLEHRDGTYLAGAVGPGGTSLSGSLNWPEQGPQGPALSGSFRSDLAGDGAPRLVSYLQLGDVPLRLVLMRHAGAVESAWWQRVASTGGVTLVLVAGCLGLVLLFERELRHRQQVSQLLAHAEGHLRTIVNHLPSLVSYWDRDLRNLFANHLHRDLFGLLPEVLRGQTLPDVVGPALMHRYGPYIKLALAGEAQTFEWPVKLSGEGLRTLLVSLAPDLREGRVAGIFAQLMDISDRKQAESQVFEEKERFRVTLSSIGDAVITVDVAGRVTYLNPVAEMMTDWRLDLARGEPVEVVMPIVNSVDGSPLRNPVRLALELQDTVGLAADTALVRRDGQRFDIEDSASPIKDRHGEIIGAVMVFHDVSEMRSMAIRMAHLAQHDALTGLPNRLMLYDRAEQAIALAQREQEQVAVMYLDLDRFKTVNDSLGHEVGDRLLVDFARRLSGAMRHSDTLSRQGGDEFVILQTGLKDPAQAGHLARKLLRLCSEPFVVQGRELNVSVTIGIALFPGDGNNFDELAKHADAALYAAKNAGRNRFHYFTRELGVAAHQRLQQEQALKAALGHGEIFLEYQPKVDFSADQIVGVEALARWRWSGQRVSPVQFIPLAEESGLIIEIGRHILRTACEEASRLNGLGLLAAPMAVNVSVRQLADPGFVSEVQQVLKSTGLPPALLEIEVTESGLMQDMEAMSGVLRALKALGLRIAIDDFGTGYSSLAYLATLPVDVLKIDKSFVDDYQASPKNMAIITAIIDLAHHLQLEVIAEGVESREQADFLVAFGCCNMQGYYFSRPVSAPELQAWCEARADMVLSA